VAEDGTDVGALAQGYISVTPLTMDMTAYSLLDELREWEREIGQLDDEWS
jgi:5'-nucleotidase